METQLFILSTVESDKKFFRVIKKLFWVQQRNLSGANKSSSTKKLLDAKKAFVKLM